jgi:uncharacterized protein
VLDRETREAALDLAVTSIRHGLSGTRWLPRVPDLPVGLQVDGAAFVTLRIGPALRGCIGSLEARQPLGIDIARHATDAAFSDPRFPPLTAVELEPLHVEVSVLGAMEPLAADTWAELEHLVRPGVDGLLVESRWHRGTFLPSVWAQLPDPEAFLVALWRKAGLVPREWPVDLVVSRYTTEEFGALARDHARAA